ncbi:recombinase family protein [Shinella zoogloeoides]|uniref:recombinase family protein n=1 Tax=Shinella zoogloeoides TaxID=352475 RepID=UPI0035314FF1
MTRVALYARYSSDNQREASIDDQYRICREQAKREKWKVVGTYKDAGISGASMILRPGAAAGCAGRPVRYRARRGAGSHQPRPGRRGHVLQAPEVRRRADHHPGRG